MVQLGDKLFAGSDWREHGLVCTMPQGTIMTHLGAMLHAACARAGLPRMRVHDLRHSAASLLAADGHSVRAIMDWLGHTSPAMALHYTHIVAQQRAATARAFDGLMAEREVG